MPQRKAISPIIAIIILLLITIAIAGAGYSYLSAYWTGLVGREMQVVGSFCAGGSQGKVMVKNIGTSPLNTGEIAVINPLTGEDITQDVLWSSSVTGSIDDPSLVLEMMFNEGSGTLASDTSGNGNDGTLEGDTTWVDGKIGGALDFDGVNDYVDCGNGVSLNIISAFSISTWVKLKDTSNIQFLIQKSSGGFYQQQNYWIEIYDSKFRAGIGNASLWAVNQISGTSSVIADQWYHIVFTVDGTNLVLSIDGQSTSVGQTIVPESGNEVLSIGAFRRNAYFFNGTIDDVRIYNRSLSPEEIKNLAENSVLVQPGETATLTHTCSGTCGYSLVLGGMTKEAMLEC